MLLELIRNTATIQGNVADQLKTKRLSLIPTIIILITGVIYGIYLFYSKNVESFGLTKYIYLFFFMITGFSFMVANQLGISALLWSACKAFKGTAGFLNLFNAVGYVFLPYGLLTIMLNAYNNQIIHNRLLVTVVILCCATVIFHQLTKIIHLLAGFTTNKSYACIAFTYIFLGCFIFLFMF